MALATVDAGIWKPRVAVLLGVAVLLMGVLELSYLSGKPAAGVYPHVTHVSLKKQTTYIHESLKRATYIGTCSEAIRPPSAAQRTFTVVAIH